MKVTKKDLVDMGYPKKIKGNGGYIAVLVDVQPLNEGEVAGIYRYPRGECVHFLEEMKHFEPIDD